MKFNGYEIHCGIKLDKVPKQHPVVWMWRLFFTVTNVDALRKSVERAAKRNDYKDDWM